jgi:hypothetical protein
LDEPDHIYSNFRRGNIPDPFENAREIELEAQFAEA